MSRRTGLRGALAAACLLTGLVATGVATPDAAAAVRPCSRGLVALTFDDGPANKVTRRLIDVLTTHKVPATFFVVGERVASAPGLVRLAHRRGFVIGNHTYRHEMLTRLSDSGVRSTLRATRRAVVAAGAKPSSLMRPPYGAIDSGVRDVVAGMGLTPVLWDVDPQDWRQMSAATLTSRVLGALRPGSDNVVLLHDGVKRSGTTLQAVPSIIDGARKRGYCFADLGPSGRPTPPVPTARVSDAAVTEGDPGSTASLRFTLRLDRPTSRPVSVRVRTAPGTAEAGADFRVVTTRVGFPAGVTSRRVTVAVLGDRIDEKSERLRLLLSEPSGLRVADGAGIGTIRDDDPPPRVSVGDATVTEPPAGSAIAAVPITLDRPSSRKVVLVVATSPLDADDTDFVPFESTLVVEPGRLESAVEVEVLADALAEDAERFEVRVVSAQRATVAKRIGTVTIQPPATG